MGVWLVGQHTAVDPPSTSAAGRKYPPSLRNATASATFPAMSSNLLLQKSTSALLTPLPSILCFEMSASMLSERLGSDVVFVLLIALARACKHNQTHPHVC